MTLSEKDIKKIRGGTLASVKIPPEYFMEGDYTHWMDTDECRDMSYKEFQKWLVNYMAEKYDDITLYSDGTIYGRKNGISYDIEYADCDVEYFIETAEKYGGVTFEDG